MTPEVAFQWIFVIAFGIIAAGLPVAAVVAAIVIGAQAIAEWRRAGR